MSSLDVNGYHFRSRAADGSGNSREIVSKTFEGSGWPTSWSRDGRHLLFTTRLSVGGQCDVWVLPLDADGRAGKPFPYDATDTCESDAVISPDGRKVAYVRKPSGRPEIHMGDFPESKNRLRVSPGLGALPTWSGDGRDLYYVDQDSYLVAARIETGADEHARVASIERLFPVKGGLGYELSLPSYAVSLDGSRVLVAEPVEATDTQQISLVLNWADRSPH